MPSDEHLLALEDYTKCNRPLPYCRAGSLIRSGILPWMNSFWATLIVVHMTPWSRCADFAFLRIGIDRTSSCNLKAESSLSFPVQSFEYVICGNLNQPGPVPWFGVPLAIPINFISPLKAWHARDDWTTGPVWTDDPRRRERYGRTSKGIQVDSGGASIRRSTHFSLPTGLGLLFASFTTYNPLFSSKHVVSHSAIRLHTQTAFTRAALKDLP